MCSRPISDIQFIIIYLPSAFAADNRKTTAKQRNSMRTFDILLQYLPIVIVVAAIASKPTVCGIILFIVIIGLYYKGMF